MEVIYEKPMVLKILDAIAFARENGKAIEKIVLTKGEFSQLCKESSEALVNCWVDVEVDNHYVYTSIPYTFLRGVRIEEAR